MRLRRAFFICALAVVALLAIRYWPRAPLSAAFSTSRAVYDTHGRLLRLTLSTDEKEEIGKLPSKTG